MLQRILTHPGGSHKDEFLACAVLLARHRVPVVRREPTGADLADPAICVLDVGGEHAPDRSNFDHHQLPADATPTCALSLVLRHQGLYEDACDFCDWLEVAEWFDCRGPGDTAEWLGIGRDTLARLNSPIDITLLRRFAGRTEHHPGDPLWEIMRMIGEDMVDHISGLREKLDHIARFAEIWELDARDGTRFKALYMPRTEQTPGDPSSGLDRYVRREGLADEILALVYPDRRGDGFGLRRFNDTLRLDFTTVAREDDVHFAHARGFLAKTSATEARRLRELLIAAYTAKIPEQA